MRKHDNSLRLVTATEEYVYHFIDRNYSVLMNRLSGKIEHSHSECLGVLNRNPPRRSLFHLGQGETQHAVAELRIDLFLIKNLGEGINRFDIVNNVEKIFCCIIFSIL